MLPAAVSFLLCPSSVNSHPPSLELWKAALRSGLYLTLTRDEVLNIHKVSEEVFDSLKGCVGPPPVVWRWNSRWKDLKNGWSCSCSCQPIGTLYGDGNFIPCMGIHNLNTWTLDLTVINNHHIYVYIYIYIYIMIYNRIIIHNNISYNNDLIMIMVYSKSLIIRQILIHYSSIANLFVNSFKNITFFPNSGDVPE